jgi:hypothetical protein
MKRRNLSSSRHGQIYTSNGAKYRTVMSPFCWGEFVFAEGRLDSGARGILAASRLLIDGEIAAIFLRHHLGGKCPCSPCPGLNPEAGTRGSCC